LQQILGRNIKKLIDLTASLRVGSPATGRQISSDYAGGGYSGSLVIERGYKDEKKYVGIFSGAPFVVDKQGTTYETVLELIERVKAKETERIADEKTAEGIVPGGDF
jgi:hypothetical protein